jgi:hypothetical protein
MKKHIASFLVFACLGALSWAQGTKTELFDVRKSGQEIEIMKGILSTTLSFVAQNLQKQQAATKQAGTPTPFGTALGTSSWRFSNINAFYLYGQGAVFVIPTSGLRLASYGEAMNIYETYSRDLQRASREVEVRTQELALRSAAVAASASGVAGGLAGGLAGGVNTPPTPPKPPAPPARPAQASQEELRKNLADAQEKVKKSQEVAEANRAKFMVALGEIKTYLTEALANHGDSLTTVKSNEYITLIIMTDGYDGAELLDAAGSKTNREIISIQKSWITDYKAGRLTLDAFKQKVLQYSE